jgi:hypothetical protein
MAALTTYSISNAMYYKTIGFRPAERLFTDYSCWQYAANSFAGLRCRRIGQQLIEERRQAPEN